MAEATHAKIWPGLPAPQCADPERATASRRSGARHRLIRLAPPVVVAVVLVVLHDHLPDPAAIWSLVIAADPGWLALVIVAEILSMSAFARLQRRLLRTGGVQISLRRACAVTYAGNALSTTLPAGPAVSVLYSFRQFRRDGASAQVATAVILLGGVVTTTAYTFIGVAALLDEHRSRAPTLIALAVAAALGVVSWRSASARRGLRGLIRRCARTAPIQRHVAPIAGSAAGIREVLRLGRRDWGVLVALAVLNWIFEILALVAATRALGLDVAPHHIMFAYFAAQAAGSLLPLLPGGLGAIEAGLVTALVGFGATAAPAGAAVAVYRLVSFWAVVAVGWLAWFALRASDRTGRALRAHPPRAWRPAVTGLVVPRRGRALAPEAPGPLG
ncbi:YbhN family protein [Actinomadura sp. HBU206391]|uniref:lysylphosphatidylglycerol synthase transmembrane domain-containing protein n=1 Tax=Actinomadura sp. HBU206391 TaxID=2731692 RepID=UPI00164F5721|nr:lysylphosphatidylglycerol synthase transmembrane domain-containing protein [Actinomadura sp. HBU206391]MBC6461480.1 flippase-like domain-containing protein [Actinomadura sp. HBU206391]